jgi:hypothetical protein
MSNLFYAHKERYFVMTWMEKHDHVRELRF